MTYHDLIRRMTLLSPVLADDVADELERLRAFVQWVANQIDNEDADLDEIITRAESVLRGISGENCGEKKMQEESQ